MIGCSDTAVTHWETGRHRPVHVFAVRLEEVLGQPVEHLLAPDTQN